MFMRHGGIGISESHRYGPVAAGPSGRTPVMRNLCAADAEPVRRVIRATPDRLRHPAWSRAHPA